MSFAYLSRHFTPDVLRAQENAYGRSQAVPTVETRDLLGVEERAFIRTRDSFYLGTVTEDGAPYLQHRGGPAGFLHVVSDDTLLFPDFSGNRQLLSTGHVSREPRVALFLMDYVQRQRLKIDARAEILASDHAAAASYPRELLPPRARVERWFNLQITALDWNCPKYITPRYTLPEIEALVAPLKERIRELESKLAR